MWSEGTFINASGHMNINDIPDAGLAAPLLPLLLNGFASEMQTHLKCSVSLVAEHLALLVQCTNPHSAICSDDVSTSVGNYSHIYISQDRYC